MQSNNNNNDISWKAKLEELESLPEETFDSNVAWEKLHSRSKENTASKKTGWYWMAAACLLTVGVASILFSNSGNDMKAAGNITIKSHNDLFKLNNIAVAPITPPDIIKQAVTTDKKTLTTNTTAVPDTSAIIAKQTTEAVLQTITLPLIQDTFTKLVAATPVKKKLRVVHLNEINQQEENMAATEKGRPYFPVKFKSREILSSHTTDNTSGRDNLIRIKLSPQN